MRMRLELAQSRSLIGDGSAQTLVTGKSTLAEVTVMTVLSIFFASWPNQEPGPNQVMHYDLASSVPPLIVRS